MKSRSKAACRIRPRMLAFGAVGAALAAALALPITAGAQAVVVTTPEPPRPPQIAVRQPTGWLGIRYSGDVRHEMVGGKPVVVYVSYPVVESVESGSPADRAGLLAGDTILAFNDKDLRAEPILLNEMLRPGKTMKVRVRRNRAVRELDVQVEKRPTPSASAYQYRYEVTPNPRFEEEVRQQVERALEQTRRQVERERQLAQRELDREQADTEREREAAQREVQRELQRAQREIQRELARAQAELRRAGTISPIAFTVGRLSAVAGAEMTLLNEDLADLVGARRGVFVVSVSPNSPADRAGLRGGDVIAAVGNVTVNDLAQLRSAIQSAQQRARRDGGEDAVELQIVRKHRRQKLSLKF